MGSEMCIRDRALVCQRMVDTVAVTDLETYLQQSTIEYSDQPGPNEICTEGPLKQRRCVCVRERLREIVKSFHGLT